jgi:hypothetical protein
MERRAMTCDDKKMMTSRQKGDKGESEGGVVNH